MSALADVIAEQNSLKSRIRALGSPPAGDPGEFVDLAIFLRKEAAHALEFAKREARLPAKIDFVSGGALRLFANMGQVAESFAVAYTMLENAAQAMETHAHQLRDAQADWIRQRTALDGRLADLEHRAKRLSA